MFQNARICIFFRLGIFTFPSPVRGVGSLTLAWFVELSTWISVNFYISCEVGRFSHSSLIRWTIYLDLKSTFPSPVRGEGSLALAWFVEQSNWISEYFSISCERCWFSHSSLVRWPIYLYLKSTYTYPVRSEGSLTLDWCGELSTWIPEYFSISCER